MVDPMTLRSKLLTVLVALASVAVALAGWMTTWIEYSKTPGSGELLVAVRQANFGAAPLAVLLFAMAFTWLRCRLWWRALVAAFALPAWCYFLAGHPSWLGNETWVLMLLMRMQGVQFYGVS
jgi:glucan phosphoethanolaminetransferase (alkaline phosphatase superfamily)